MNAADVSEVFEEQFSGHSGGLTQTHAKAIDDFRRDATKKLEEFVQAQPAKTL